MHPLEKEQDFERAKSDPFLEATDIPLRGEHEPKRLKFVQLVPALKDLPAFSSVATITYTLTEI
jgi:hypothetical protein